ncbi:hypothetical protein DN069_01455 [Streptacidiphilus pinicola]|uniref:Uncharacterized protein n=1 Tax=Streptacidiphilus pinicola TaxID=2219663 RepID=A0A2X0KDX6_9ACTN|nr:hypothetical protein DN069_01455 [Streptacidiphilus pinicola]
MCATSPHAVKGFTLLGTLALLVVQTLCSFSVIAYFRRNHPESRHWFRTAAGAADKVLFFRFIPPIVGLVFLAGIGLAPCTCGPGIRSATS